MLNLTSLAAAGIGFFFSALVRVFAIANLFIALTYVFMMVRELRAPFQYTLIARYMGPIWGRQDPGGPHVGPMNFAIWVNMQSCPYRNSHNKHSVYRGSLASIGIPIINIQYDRCSLASIGIPIINIQYTDAILPV